MLLDSINYFYTQQIYGSHIETFLSLDMTNN